MALIKCPECSKEISNKAPACPSCGEPIKSPKQKTSFTTWLVLCLIIVGVLSSVNSGRNSKQVAAPNATAEQQQAARLTPEQRAAETKEKADKKAALERQQKLNNARYACKEFVKRNLNDPGSADFENHRTFWAREAKDGSFDVQVHVRARNSFNALIASVFECKTRVIGDNWVAVKIKQLTP